MEKVPEGFAKRPPGQPARHMLSGDVPFDMLTGMSAIHCATERAEHCEKRRLSRIIRSEWQARTKSPMRWENKLS